MNDVSPSMDLISLAEDFIAAKQEEISLELSRKYLLSSDEVSEIVSTFLEDSYGPAMALAGEIAGREGLVLLFIGRKDCAICQRCYPVLERFIIEHREIEPVILDYSQPLIAFIFKGKMMMKTCGECAAEHVYEKCYRDIRDDCSQNLYVH